MAHQGSVETKSSGDGSLGERIVSAHWELTGNLQLPINESPTSLRGYYAAWCVEI